MVHLMHDDEDSRAPVVGFVVSKSVGGAVVRNRTKRRLRALIRPLLTELTPGTRLVVRALPAAAGSTAAALRQDLLHALGRAAGTAPTPTERRS